MRMLWSYTAPTWAGKFLNANAKLRFRKAYGFRTLDAAEVELYQ